MSTLIIAHSHFRWLVILVAAVAIVKFAIGWYRGDTFKSMDRGLAARFSGTVDLQATLGLIVFLWDGFTGAGFPMYRIEHATTMLIAAVVAHLHVLWKNSEDKVRFRNSLFIVVDVLVLVFIGIARLPNGLTR